MGTKLRAYESLYAMSHWQDDSMVWKEGLPTSGQIHRIKKLKQCMIMSARG